jgi:hypothetical protein
LKIIKKKFENRAITKKVFLLAPKPETLWGTLYIKLLRQFCYVYLNYLLTYVSWWALWQKRVLTPHCAGGGWSSLLPGWSSLLLFILLLFCEKVTRLHEGACAPPPNYSSLDYYVVHLQRFQLNCQRVFEPIDTDTEWLDEEGIFNYIGWPLDLQEDFRHEHDWWTSYTHHSW